MADNQKSTNSSVQRLKISVETKQILIKNRKVNIQPIIESIRKELESVPSTVGEAMGIPFPDDVTEVKILNSKQYLERTDCGCGKSHGIGNYEPGSNEFLIDVETIIGDIYLEDFMNFRKETRKDIVSVAWHEAAHLNHFSYNYDMFITCHRAGVCKKKPKFTIWDKIYCRIYKWLNKWKMQKNLILKEGIAHWVQDDLMEKNFGPGSAWFFERDLNAPRILEKRMDFIDKSIFFWNVGDNFAYLFIESINQITGRNPIKLIIDNPPKIREMYKPRKYVKRMKKEKKI